jgi:hypothetical protein
MACRPGAAPDRRVLEARLHKLVRGMSGYLYIWCDCRESHPDALPGREPFGCYITTARKVKRAGDAGISRPAISTKNKHLLVVLEDPNPRFHGGCFGVYGHTSCEALNM